MLGPIPSSLMKPCGQVLLPMALIPQAKTGASPCIAGRILQSQIILGGNLAWNVPAIFIRLIA